MEATPILRGRPSARTTAALVVACAALVVGCGGGSKSSSSGSGSQAAGAPPPCAAGLSALGSGICVDKQDPRAKQIAALVPRLARTYNLRASVFGLWANGRPLVSGAVGSALPGVPATVQDHFRISNVTEAFSATLLLKLAEQGKLRLTDPVSKWLPWLPHANQVTLRMLASTSSGYADFITNPKFVQALYHDPFRIWRPEELIRLGVSRPSLFPPGKSWAFSDTNFMILGDILTRVGGEPLGDQLRQQILDPLGLHDTALQYTAAIPSPVLHGYDPERGVYEDATNWSVTWGQYIAAMTSNLADMGRWARALGTGEVLSPASHQAQVGPANVGLGPLRKDFYYGLGVGVARQWIISNPHLPGYSGVVAYFPPAGLSLVIFSTPALGNPDRINDSQAVFLRAARILTPNSAPAFAQRANG